MAHNKTIACLEISKSARWGAIPIEFPWMMDLKGHVLQLLNGQILILNIGEQLNDFK